MRLTIWLVIMAVLFAGCSTTEQIGVSIFIDECKSLGATPVFYYSKTGALLRNECVDMSDITQVDETNI